MSDTLLLLILVALNLAFASALAFTRLRAVGWSGGKAWAMVGEMWAFFAVVVAACWWASTRIGGSAAGRGLPVELPAIAERFSEATAGEKALLVGAAVLLIALFGHLLSSLNKGMHGGPQ